MKIVFLAALVMPSLLIAQSSPALLRPESVTVRSAAPQQVIHVQLAMDGQLMGRIGIELPDTGRVALSGSLGSATTPAYFELLNRPGRIEVAAPVHGPELEITITRRDRSQRQTIARGHSVILERDQQGRLNIQAAALTTVH